MSRDLIERLREHGNYGAGTTNQAMNLCNEAADRIAALEAAVYEHKTAADAFEACWKDAKTALEAEASEGERGGLERAAEVAEREIEDAWAQGVGRADGVATLNQALATANFCLAVPAAIRALIPEAPAREGE